MPQIDAQPYAFKFDPATAALVIIDMQRDFVDPGGFGEALGNDVVAAAQGHRADPARARRGARGRACWSSTPARAIAPTSPISAAGQEGARQARRPASATRARWAASWSAASTATTSSTN